MPTEQSVLIFTPEEAESVKAYSIEDAEQKGINSNTILYIKFTPSGLLHQFWLPCFKANPS